MYVYVCCNCNYCIVGLLEWLGGFDLSQVHTIKMQDAHNKVSALALVSCE